MKIKYSLVICLLSYILFCGCETRSSDELVYDAYLLSQEGNYSGSKELLDLAISKNPYNIIAYINRGADHAELDQYEDAIEDYNSVIKIDPDNELAKFNIGNNFRRLQKFEVSNEKLTELLEQKGHENFFKRHTHSLLTFEFENDKFKTDVEDIVYTMSYNYLDLENYDYAIKGFNYCLSKKFESGDVNFQLGNIHLKLNDTTNAEYYFEKATKFGYKNPLPHNDSIQVKL